MDVANFLTAFTHTNQSFPLYRINGQWEGGDVWRWVVETGNSGKDISYKNWAPGQPDPLGNVMISSLESKRMAYSNHFQHLPNHRVDRAYAFCL